MIKPKLVRDKIPDIIKNDHKSPVFHIADKNEFTKKLKQKLQEEVSEFLESESPEELADILEVIYALAQIQNVSQKRIESIRVKKRKTNGGFKKKIILDKIK